MLIGGVILPARKLLLITMSLVNVMLKNDGNISIGHVAHFLVKVYRDCSTTDDH
jgi:hypothetical protein